jgi:glycerol-3-phosphate dehydrogenase
MQEAVANRIAVVGGGGAWELARRDYDVVLFEKGRCGAQTSSATTKMIHGGLRYLEQLRVGLVRESLRERAWLLARIPELVKAVEILVPMYADSPRRRSTVKLGLLLYDALAGSANIAKHRFLSTQNVLERVPLVPDGLHGAFSYWDAQVDDYALVRTVVASALRDGARVREETRVDEIFREGEEWVIRTSHGDESRFDLVVNAAGPWMNELLRRNGIEAPYTLSLVRGTHIVLEHRVSEPGLLLQSSSDRRVFFVLPWKETTLVGTTEVLQVEPPDSVHPTDEEIEYLVRRFNRYFRDPITHRDIASAFAGVRPLVGRATNPSAIDRDFRVLRDGNLINVFGGKMTTFMALARKVAMRADNYFGHTRDAREPVFASRSEDCTPEISPLATLVQ